MNGVDRSRPNFKKTIAIVAAIVLLSLAVLGGGFALTVHEINQQNATAAQLHTREAESSVRVAVPLCQALADMDNASVGASDDKDSYGHRLAAAIHKLVLSTKCDILLSDLKKHESYLQIERQLSK